MKPSWQTPWNVFGSDVARWSCAPEPTVDGLRECRVTFGPASHLPIIISLATASHVAAARALREDCQRLGLDHDIAYVELPDPPASTRQCATRLKRGYIQSMLTLHQRPVWWLDVDGRLLGRPPEIPLSTWLVVHPQPKKPDYPIKSSVLFLRPGDGARRLLETWHHYHQPHTEDHTPLIRAWRLVSATGVMQMDSGKWLRVDGSKHLVRPDQKPVDIVPGQG